MKNTLTLTLEGKAHEIQELTFGQVEDIQELIAAYGTTNVTISKENARGIVAVALSVDHPQITRESLYKMRLGSIKHLNDMVRGVLVFGGFIDEKKGVKLKETAPGEVKPGEAEAAAQ